MAFFRSSNVRSFHSLKGMYWVLKPLCNRKSESARNRSSASMPKSSPVYLEYLTFIEERGSSPARAQARPPLVILTAQVRPLRRPFLARRFALALSRAEFPLLVAADPPVRVQTLQHELRGRCAHRIRLVGRELQRLQLLHQALDRSQRMHHGRRVLALVEFQRAAQIEPLHNLRHVGAFEILVVNLAYGHANQLTRHRIAALQLALV